MPKLEIPDSFTKYVSIFTRGAIIQMAPAIARGMLLEMLKVRKVDVKTISKLVQDRANLWVLAGEHYQELGRRIAVRVGNLDWMTAEWVIDAIKADYPAISSLFLGWKKASNWLERQIEFIKEKLSGTT